MLTSFWYPTLGLKGYQDVPTPNRANTRPQEPCAQEMLAAMCARIFSGTAQASLQVRAPAQGGQ